MNLVEDLRLSIFENTVDVGMDYAELYLDNIIDSISDNEILKKIPVVKTLYSLGKVGAAIHEKNLLRKTLIFITSFNSKTIKPKKLEKYKKRIKEKPCYVQEELGRVLLILNRTLDDSKAQILANIYRNYVEEEITWDEFCELTDITERIFLTDIGALLKGHENNGLNLDEVENYHLDRLIALGLLENSMRLGGEVILDCGDAAWDEESNKDSGVSKAVIITKLGELYCRCGLTN